VAERLRFVAIPVHHRPCVLQDVIGFGGIRHEFSSSVDVLTDKGKTRFISLASDSVACRTAGHFMGTRIGALLSLTKNTTNLAVAVWLAFRATVCTSPGSS
jgi:hypothetical protein